jgi:hypothetical protein
VGGISTCSHRCKRRRGPSTRCHVNCSTITSNSTCRCCGRCKPSTLPPMSPRLAPTGLSVAPPFESTVTYQPARRYAAPLAIEPIVVKAIDADTIVVTEHLTIMPYGHQQYQQYHRLPVAPLRQRFVGAVEPSFAPSSPRRSWHVLSGVLLSAKIFAPPMYRSCLRRRDCLGSVRNSKSICLLA